MAFRKLFIDNYDLYNNNELGQELLRRMEKMMENMDSIFYYDKVEFAKTVGARKLVLANESLLALITAKMKQLKV